MFGNFERIRQVKEKNLDSLFKKRNVVGVGIGQKVSRGRPTNELCIKIYVERKRSASQLKARDLIKPEINGIKTDIVGIGKLRFLQCDQKTRKRPAEGGDSVGSCHSTAYGYTMAGTLGCVVIDKTDGHRCILSNNHVLADKDSDTDSRASAGDVVVQPGTLDGGSCSTDRIGTLKRWIPFISSGDNIVDAAIADLDNDADVQTQIGCDIGEVNGIRELVAADIDNLQVQKCGRTTCYTTGTIVDIDVTCDVGYEVLTPSGPVGRSYRFIHQIFITDMSDPGDSGSLILDMDRKAVGLLFAGSSTITVASPIQTVFNEMDIEFPPPEIHCFIGGPDNRCKPGGPFLHHCKPGGPHLVFCKPGGPRNILCIPGGPNNQICRLGGPDNLICKIGGPNIACVAGGPDSPCVSGGPQLVCQPGGPIFGGPGGCAPGGPDSGIQPLCLACGPDSPIPCGSGGPDLLVDIGGCPSGPDMSINFKDPITNPRKLLMIDLDKMPKGMQRSLMQMMKEMGKKK